MPKLNLKQKDFGQDIDSPSSSESDRTENSEKKFMSPTIPILGKRLPIGAPFSIKIPQKDTDSPSSSESDRKSGDGKKRTRRVKLDLLLGDFCTEFEVEGRMTKEDLKSNLDNTMFGEDKGDLSFEFYQIKGFNETNSPVEHYACKPLNQDFNVKLLKQLMYENKGLKVKLERSNKLIDVLTEEKKVLKEELNKEKKEISGEDQVKELKQKVQVYEKLRLDVLKQLEYLKGQQLLLEEQ